MKKLLLILILPLLTVGCKSTKNADCDAYGSNKKLQVGETHRNIKCETYTDCIICVDSLRSEPLHVHFYYHDTQEWSCLYMPKDEFVFVDTFYFKENKFHVND